LCVFAPCTLEFLRPKDSCSFSSQSSSSSLPKTQLLRSPLPIPHRCRHPPPPPAPAPAPPRRRHRPSRFQLHKAQAFHTSIVRGMLGTRCSARHAPISTHALEVRVLWVSDRGWGLALRGLTCGRVGTCLQRLASLTARVFIEGHEIWRVEGKLRIILRMCTDGQAAGREGRGMPACLSVAAHVFRCICRCKWCTTCIPTQSSSSSSSPRASKLVAAAAAAAALPPLARVTRAQHNARLRWDGGPTGYF